MNRERAMKPNEDGWLDAAAGECVKATRTAADAAGAALARWGRLAGRVEELAAEVTAGAEEATRTLEATRHAAAMAAGVWYEWRRLKPIVARYSLLLGGGGFSVCGVALIFMLWPQPAATACAPAENPAVFAGGEERVAGLISAGRYDEAGRAAVGLPDPRRYHLLGEIEAARGNREAADWFHWRAAQMGDPLARDAVNARCTRTATSPDPRCPACIE
jgi:hypothetical protein